MECITLIPMLHWQTEISQVGQTESILLIGIHWDFDVDNGIIFWTARDLVDIRNVNPYYDYE